MFAFAGGTLIAVRYAWQKDVLEREVDPSYWTSHSRAAIRSMTDHAHPNPPSNTNTNTNSNTRSNTDPPSLTPMNSASAEDMTNDEQIA